MPTKQKNKKKPPNRFIVLIALSSQMGITIFLGAYVGKHLDASYLNEGPYFTIALTLFALLISLYSLLKTLNKLNDDN